MRVHKVDGGFYARVGDFFGPQAKSSHAALERLNQELENYHPLNHHYIRCGDGTVLHLFQIPSHGWNYAIIPPTGYGGKGRGVKGTFAQAKAVAELQAKEEFGGIV